MSKLPIDKNGTEIKLGCTIAYPTKSRQDNEIIRIGKVVAMYLDYNYQSQPYFRLTLSGVKDAHIPITIWRTDKVLVLSNDAMDYK